MALTGFQLPHFAPYRQLAVLTATGVQELGGILLVKLSTQNSKGNADPTY